MAFSSSADLQERHVPTAVSTSAHGRGSDAVHVRGDGALLAGVRLRAVDGKPLVRVTA